MRGIPSSYLMFFFTLVLIIELISYLGILKLFDKNHTRIRRIFKVLHVVSFICSTALLLFSFSNPELIKLSRNYNLFYVTVIIASLNLVPKFFFAIMTLFSFFIRILNKQLQMNVLSGSFLLAVSIFITIIFGIFFTRNQVVLKEENLYFDDLPIQLDGFRLVQISDLHLGTFNHHTGVMAQVASIINSANADLVLFTGDIVNNFSDEFLGYESFLSGFSAKYGKFAILGNHDYGDYYYWPDAMAKKSNLDQVKSSIEKCGFQLLLNQSATITVKDTSIILIGVENWGHRPFPQYADLGKAMMNVKAKSFKILMSHDPAHWKAAVVRQTNIPLTLSGHTHGGQLGFKIAGIEFSPICFIQKFWGGLYKSDNQYLYVNKGIGTIGFSGRIEMNPEVSLLILHKAKTINH